MTRDQIIEALREMPADATVDDAIERLVFLAKIEEGLVELDTAGRRGGVRPTGRRLRMEALADVSAFDCARRESRYRAAGRCPDTRRCRRPLACARPLSPLRPVCP